MIVVVVTVADCERAQTNWFRTRASRLGGTVWSDDELLWTDGPDGMNLMFPRTLNSAALQRGVDRAYALGRGIVGAWLSTEVDASTLLEAGFERGWAPWWMTPDLALVPQTRDPRVGLAEDSVEYRGEHAGYRDQLALNRIRPACAWYAAAHTPKSARFAVHAWSFRDGDLAGVIDLEVWPPFRRRGIGTGLLATVCTAARQAGARTAVLNPTPEGTLLFRAAGFTRSAKASPGGTT